MTGKRAIVPRFFLLILLPVAAVTLVVGVINVLSVANLRETHRQISVQQAHDIEIVATATRINEQMAGVQRTVVATLERAAAGQVDEGTAYLSHVAVVNRLAEIEAELRRLDQARAWEQQYREARREFEDYRRLAVQATDLAAIDPPGAMRFAYGAANAYVAVSEHTHAIAQAAAVVAARRGDVEAESFQRHAARISLISGMVILGVLAFWLGTSQWLVRRLSKLTAVLTGLVDDRCGPSDLDEVRRIASDPRGMLHDMARAIAAFQEAIVQRRLAEARLVEKNQALERSNAELEAYAYVASHDLREPLRNIIAFSTMLSRKLEGRLHEDEREVLTILGDAATRMNALVLDLLEVSRVGRSEQRMEVVALKDVVADALSSLQVQIAEAEARVEIDGGLPAITGNADELGRVFTNLIGNALKYRGEQAPLVVIGCRENDPRTWLVRVQDNGIGLEPGQGYEERIFGLFQRLHARDSFGGGTGIGLTICRKIITRHGGRIWAESDGPGKGTRFMILLPKAGTTDTGA